MAAGGLSIGNDRVDGQNCTFRQLLTRAYDVKDYQVVGPDWITTNRYVVGAKAPAGTTKEQLPLMLQTLLAQRFKLALHRETRQLPMFALVVDKKGLKLKTVDEAQGVEFGMRRIAGHVQLSGLAVLLTRLTEYPVIDETNTPGTFDVKLDWIAEDKMSMPSAISEALQSQAGLKLEAKKGPVEVLIIDHVEKVPTEN